MINHKATRCIAVALFLFVQALTFTDSSADNLSTDARLNLRLNKVQFTSTLASTKTTNTERGNAEQTNSVETDNSPRPSASLRFTLKDKNGFPQDSSEVSFDCLDKIFAVTQVTGFNAGKHVVEFRWIDPNGRTRERTQYDFHVGQQPAVTLSSWLELSRAQGAGMIQWLNPAAGLEEFIGDWTLELTLNGKTFNSKEFEVLC